MLYLVDSSIYIFRGWQSLPSSLTNTFGEPANASIGFANTVAQVIAEVQPTHMVCAFDQCRGNGERHRIFPDYKANRPPAPAELRVQFSRCRQIAKAMGLPVFGSDRVEADDIIGQFAGLAHRNSMPATIISADKDLAQFIRHGDCYWDLARRRRLDMHGLQKRFKVQTHQIPDWLALSGDKVDNIPGVPGVGPATAARLLIKWGCLENLLQNIDAVADMQFRGAPRISALLREYTDTIWLARRLTGLIEDPTLPRCMEALARQSRSYTTLVSDLLETGLPANHCAQLAQLISPASST